jgi:hypothetical protein
MTKNNQLQHIDLEKIDSLESYSFHLGLLCVSILTLAKLQDKAESIGIFNTDEEEASKMMRYQIQRLFTCCDDLLRMTVQRTGQDWDEWKQNMLKQAAGEIANESVETGSKSVIRKKGKKK